MNTPKNHWIDGSHVTLEDILNHREMRCEKQLYLLDKYPGTLICYTLNIAGPVKYSPLIRQTFQYGIQEIEKRLKEYQNSILHYEEMQGGAGCAAFFSVQEDPLFLKQQMADIEDTHPVGRLFDIDVLSPDGSKVSRQILNLSQRKCLLCHKPAFVCGRSREHSARELSNYQNQIMWDYHAQCNADKIGAWFIRAMMYEVTTTPKPGLVDRWHNGSHLDMDIDLFMDSIYSLQDYFTQCAHTGFCFTGELPVLFERLRQLGKKAEKTMLEATGGINTHKGLIFSGGILSGAVGYCLSYGTEKNRHHLGNICEQMLVNLPDDYKALKCRTHLSHGEQLYLKYGITGIRGEAAAGFPLVLEVMYPEFCELVRSGIGIFKSGRIILLYLIAYSEDTNIIHRSDYETFAAMQYKLKKYLSEQGKTPFDEEKVIQELDKYFVRKNISPGGSADLLALIYFLYFAGY